MTTRWKTRWGQARDGRGGGAAVDLYSGDRDSRLGRGELWEGVLLMGGSFAWTDSKAATGVHECMAGCSSANAGPFAFAVTGSDTYRVPFLRLSLPVT